MALMGEEKLMLPTLNYKLMQCPCGKASKMAKELSQPH